MKRAGGEREVQAGTTERVPDSLANQRVCVVVFGVVLEPILHFVIHAVIAKISDAHYRRDLVGNIVGFAHGFADDVNSFCRRVSVEGVEIDYSCIQVVARTDLNRFFGGVTVGYQNDMIGERADLESPPANLFDHSRVPLSAHGYDVAHLKRAICLQRDSRKEVSEGVLERQTEDDTEDCRGGE